MECEDVVMQKIDMFFSIRYFFLVFTGLIVLGVFNGLIFLPVLLVLVGPPAEVIHAVDKDAKEIDPIEDPNDVCSKSSSRKMQKQQKNAAAEKISCSRSGINSEAAPSFKVKEESRGRKHQLHHSDLSLSTIAEESGSYVSNNGHDTFPMTSQSLNGAASVFVEPHVVVETTTYPHVRFMNNSINFQCIHLMNLSLQGSSNGSSRCSTPTTTKVSVTSKFKVEVHSTPAMDPPARPASSRSSRSRSSKESLSSGSSSVHSSLSDSLRSSLSSNDGGTDAGFSEK